MSESIIDTYSNFIEKYGKYMKPIGSYIIISLVVIFLYFKINLASKDPNAFTKNFILNIITIVGPVILILGLIVTISFEEDLKTIVIFGSILICAVIFIVFYFLKKDISKYIFNPYLLYIIVIFLILIGLSIIFTIFSGTLRKLSGWTGFISNFLFFIPCLIRDLIKNLIQEYNTSSTTVFVLFILEILLIIMYFLIVPLINDKTFPEKTVIYEDPVMLNTELDISNHLTDKTSSNFSLSMWVYLNALPNTKLGYTKETTIFNYSNNNSPHVKITYFNNEKGSNDFFMYVGSEKFNISLPLQKWNNFVINYVTYDPVEPTLSPIKRETYPDGSVYVGEMKEEKKNGKGQMKYSNGDLYDGVWKDGKQHGFAKFTYANGTIEQGEWSEGKQKSVVHYDKTDGKINNMNKGSIQYTDGSYYEGDIKDGKKHGFGKITDPANPNNSKQGYWQNDMFKVNDEGAAEWIETNAEELQNITRKTYTVDIFINGNLERSYTFKESETPIFVNTDRIIIGSGSLADNSGLYGAICNVVYYKKPLSQLSIIYNYNMLSVRNPPI
jgi:hypothetical protein